jgi:hypothetical protein
MYFMPSSIVYVINQSFTARKARRVIFQNPGTILASMGGMKRRRLSCLTNLGNWAKKRLKKDITEPLGEENLNVTVSMDVIAKGIGLTVERRHIL